MNKYLLITSRNLGYDSTHIIINTDSWNNALYKAYEYIGGLLYKGSFQNAVCNNKTTSEGAINLFQQLTGEFVLYFGIVDNAFKCDITEI